MIFHGMAKSPPKNGSKISRNAVSGRYVTVGRTSDGVTVLESSKKPKHFTSREARTTIANSRLEPAKRK